MQKPIFTRRIRLHFLLVLSCTILLILCSHVAARATPFEIGIRSAQPGNLFTSTSIDLWIHFDGTPPNSLEYAIAEEDSDWSESGRISIPAAIDRQTIPFQLQLPERGLYHLTVVGRSGASQNQTGTKIGVVLQPAPPDLNSRWGVFTIPYEGEHNLEQATTLARSQRLLGASWSRLNFWHWAYENLQITSASAPNSATKIESTSTQPQWLNRICSLLRQVFQTDSQISVSFSKWKGIAKALHQEGIAIMGEFSEMPQALSSRPDATQKTTEGSAEWARVKPSSYSLWNQLVEQTAREFQAEIQYWEIWNEPDARNFWLGTPEEFAELIRQTAQAVKRGNPAAKIVASGFTSNGVNFLERVLRQGVADSIDVFSFHTNDLAPYKALLAQYQLLDRPIWATEEHTLVGLQGMKDGYARQFHFFHRQFNSAYDGFAALVDRHWLPQIAGLTYAAAAQIIGNASVSNGIDAPTAQIYTFEPADQAIAVWRSLQDGLIDGSVTFAVTPLPDKPLEKIDALGRAETVALTEGKVTLPIQAIQFLQNASKITVVDYRLPQERPDPPQSVFPATSGRWTPEWQLMQPGAGNPPPANEFTRPFLHISTDRPPSSAGYAVEIPIRVSQPGRYQLLFLGLTTQALLETNRWASPFAWSIDRGSPTQVSAPLPSYWRSSRQGRVKNDPVAPEQMVFTGGPDIYQTLGSLELTAGNHLFRLELTAGRLTPDRTYTTFFEGIVLRPQP